MQFTGSQESILQMEIEEVVGLDSSSQRSPRRAGGISPLPEIRAVVVTDHQVSNAKFPVIYFSGNF